MARTTTSNDSPTADAQPASKKRNGRRGHRTPGLIKRGAVFHIDKIIEGRRVTESTGAKDLAEAERYLAHRRAEIRRAHVYGERPSVTMQEAAAKFLAEYCPEASLARATNNLAQVLAFVGNLDVAQVHDGVLEVYRHARRDAGIAAGTINLELATLTRVMNLAARVWRHENGRPYIDTAPLLRREKGPVVHVPYPLSWDEQRRLFGELPAHRAEAALFAVNTGLRQEELCALRWAWRVRVTELDTSIFVLPGELRDASGALVFATKTRKDRVVVLNSIAHRIVSARNIVDGEFVFPSVRNSARRMATLHGKAWCKARVAAGLPHLRVHDLRHTFGHRLRAAGVGVEDRADLLGHASGRLTTHYSAPDLQRLLEAVEKIVVERPTTVLRALPQPSRTECGARG